MNNFTYIMENFMNWSMQGYTNVLGVSVGGGFVWAFIFSIVIGYVYIKNQSVVAAAVAALIIFTVFADALLDIPEFVMVIHITVALIFTMLLLIFISKYRGG